VEGWQLGVGIVGLILAGLAAFFAWRDWDRGRGLARFDFEVAKKHVTSGEMQRANALTLRVFVWGKRGRIHVKRITVGRDPNHQAPARVHYPEDTSGARTLDVGEYALATYLSDSLSVINRGPEGPVRVACWQDAEGKPHCEPIPTDKLQEVLAEARL
jgi:hypothetical protein